MNYCEACGTTERAIRDCRVRGTFVFTLCRRCQARHAATPEGLKEEMWETLKRRAGLKT